MQERGQQRGRGQRKNMFELFSEVVDWGSAHSLCELSAMAALGKSDAARRAAQLVVRIDEAVEAGELTISYR